MRLFDIDFEGVLSSLRRNKKAKPKVTSKMETPVSNRKVIQSRQQENANGLLFREANEEYLPICNSRGFVIFPFLVDCPEPDCGRKAMSPCKGNGSCLSRHLAFTKKCQQDRAWYEHHARNAYKGGRR